MREENSLQVSLPGFAYLREKFWIKKINSKRMGEEKKAKKSKKDKEAEPTPAAPEPTPADAPADPPEEAPAESAPAAPKPKMRVVAVPVDDDEEVNAVVAIPPKRSTTGSRGSKKAQRSGSNVFSAFSEKQVAEFKEAFHMMDDDKDGVINKSDLRATYNAVGSRPPAEDELDTMLGEAPGPINFTMLLTLFANKMSGMADDDDVVINAINAFDKNGKIEAEKFRSVLITFGDRFTEKEVDDVFDNLDIDGKGRIETRQLITLLTGGEDEEGGDQHQGGMDGEADVTFTL